MKSGLRMLLAVAAMIGSVASSSAADRPVGPLSLDVALSDAYRLAARYAGAAVVRVQGESMLPFFGDGSVLVMKPVAPERLRPGMVVVYRNRFGETVSHRVESHDEAGWVVRGYNNSENDSTRVTAENLLGVVYATFYSNGSAADPIALASLMDGTIMALAAPAR